MSKAVYIHAGAQRTGTSSFQMCLHENRAVLDAAGLDPAYPGRDGVPRGRLRMRLPAPRDGLKQAPRFVEPLRQHLNRMSPDPARGLILSEENIPGIMSLFYKGRFHPAAWARLGVLAQALDAPPRHVVYVLRSYDELYVSAYRKRAEDNAVSRFADFVPGFMAMERGWPELVSDIRDILKPERLTVLPYERRGQSRDLLALLVPELSAYQLAEPKRDLNRSATDAALLALQARYQAGGTLSNKQWRDIVDEHAGDRTSHGVAQFDAEQSAVLQARYRRDIERIAEMPGLTFL